ACSKSSLLVFARYAPQPIEHRVPHGDLRAVARFGTGAVIVGAAGHVLRFDAPNDVRRELAETKTALSAIAGEGDDTWAAGESGRLLHRTASGVWERLSPDWTAPVRVLALW